MKYLAFAILVVAVAAMTAPASYAQAKGKTMTDKAAKSRGTGKDANIKSKSEANDPNAKAEAPASKGGAKTRGGECTLIVDNYTQWKIQFFADGTYEDLVGGYATLSYSFSGTYTLYARADFTDGSYYTWGPRMVTCEAPGASYRWKLE